MDSTRLAFLPIALALLASPLACGRTYDFDLVDVGQLVVAPDALLRPIFGVYTDGLRRAARGLGSDELGRERPAFSEHDPEGGTLGSISNERTFGETGPGVADAVLLALAERVTSRARGRGVAARRVTLKLRFTDFVTVTRSRTIPATNVDLEVHAVARELYREARDRPLPIRLLGLALAKLCLHPPQLRLPPFDRGERCAEAVDRVREKFGYDAVHFAGTLGRRARRVR